MKNKATNELKSVQLKYDYAHPALCSIITINKKPRVLYSCGVWYGLEGNKGQLMSLKEAIREAYKISHKYALKIVSSYYNINEPLFQ